MGHPEQPSGTDIDRRRFIKRAAAIGWATPVILTAMASSAAASHATDCVHSGSLCGTWSAAQGRCVPVPGELALGVCCEAVSAGENCEVVPTGVGGVPMDGDDCICQ